MPVHNEARRIAAKVANLLALDYPREKMQILVIGDGCTDDTLERAQAAGQGIVTVVPLAGRGGKAAGLNAGLERATGEIIVFTDAGIMLDKQSLRHLIGHFTDPQIGCVSGEDSIEASQTEGLYGTLELQLRGDEARLHLTDRSPACFSAKQR